MAYTTAYSEAEPSRAEVDAMRGVTMLEFGTHWCGHCQSAQLLIEHALSDRPDVQHIKIEDGRGKALGRSFRVKLWPTLVVLRDGEEVARCVRPTRSSEVAAVLQS